MGPVDFEDLLKQRMGLDAATIGSASIDRAVRLRMASAGLEQREDYWRQLLDSEEELQELIESVVVPETWFFRDQEAFAALVRLVVEEWLPVHRADTLRLLSVPCSTGEEPYSMIMALLDGGFSGERLRVDAVDISARALARAKSGVYGSNSFRSEDLNFRSRYFQPTGSGYALAQWLAGMVNFRQGNLLSAGFRFGEELYHVIFCRNLLIYFDRPTQERVMRTLGRFLAPDGFLFVGPAEAFLASCSGFTSVNRAMSFAFRRAGTRRVESRSDSIRRPVKAAERRAVERIPDRPIPAPPAPVDLENVGRLADAGRLREAAEKCESHLQQQGLPVSKPVRPQLGAPGLACRTVAQSPLSRGI